MAVIFFHNFEGVLSFPLGFIVEEFVFTLIVAPLKIIFPPQTDFKIVSFVWFLAIFLDVDFLTRCGFFSFLPCFRCIVFLESICLFKII